METIIFVPGAVAAGANISLPAWAKRIAQVVSAEIIRPTNQIAISAHPDHSHTENLAATYTQNATTATASIAAHTLTGANPVVACTATRVDENTITLNVATNLGDLLRLSYVALGTWY